MALRAASTDPAPEILATHVTNSSSTHAIQHWGIDTLFSLNTRHPQLTAGDVDRLTRPAPNSTALDFKGSLAKGWNQNQEPPVVPARSAASAKKKKHLDTRAMCNDPRLALGCMRAYTATTHRPARKH